MNRRASQGAGIQNKPNGWKLEIPEGDSQHYRLAQLDDYFHLPRQQFPHRTLRLSLRARASGSSIAGTWGFGLWNDPFGLSLGFGGSPFRLPALPNACWFFHASPQNHLSFREGKPAQGFLAQTFRAPAFHPLLLPAGLALPFSRKITRRLLGRVIEEDGRALSVDVTQWHRFRLQWSPERVVFEVDDVRVFESTVSPRHPLGLVIWIDNQFAAFRPNGEMRWGILPGSRSWVEIDDFGLETSHS